MWCSFCHMNILASAVLLTSLVVIIEQVEKEVSEFGGEGGSDEKEALSRVPSSDQA